MTFDRQGTFQHMMRQISRVQRHGLRGPALLAPGAATLALLLATGAHAQGPLLTEFQASNANTLLDTDGDSSDWIEVHNPSATSLDLSDWYLSDDAGDLTRWQIPSTTLLPAGAYLIVFASGKDRAVPGAEYHTNFKLKSEGEFLALIRPDGTTVEQAFSPSFPQQYADVSYGLSFDPGPTSNETYFTAPTPGSANGPGGPVIINPGFAPDDPGPGEDVRVWVSVPSDLGGGAVTLTWCLDFNGESFLPLLDDGQGADLAAGDGIYSASVPGQTFVPGQMVRWRMEAIEGSTLRSASLPPFVDPTGSAEYFGTAVRDDAVSTALPRWQYWLQNPGKGETSAGTRASVYYNGEFYDNVSVRMRGGSSAWYPKKSYKFDFNKDQRLLFPSGIRHDEANINTTWADKAFVRQTLSYELYTLAGCVSSGSYPVRLEQNGAFRSVAIFVEEPGEESFLEEHGLDPEGALYKMYNVLNSWQSGVEKKTRLQEGHKDLKQLVQALAQASPQELEILLFDAIDLDQCFNYLAVTSLIHDNDHIAKNYFLYRDSDGDKEWQFVPWDKDLTWGRNYTIAGGVLNDTLWAMKDPFSHPLFGDQAHPKNDGPHNILIDRIYSNPRTRQMYLCRLRTLMDRFLEVQSIQPHFLESWIDDLVVAMQPDVTLDQALWGIPTWGTGYSFIEDVDRLKHKYLRKRRQHLYLNHGPAGSGVIPPANPSPPIIIRFIQGDPASGKMGEEYVILSNPSPLAADISGYSMGGAIRFALPEGTVIAAGDNLYLSPNVKLFRKRTTSPTGGEGLHVTGPYIQHIESGEWVRLFDRRGALVSELQY